MHATIFDTPRLRARRIGPEDVAVMHAVYGDADARRWVNVASHRVLLEAGMQRGTLRPNDDGPSCWSTSATEM